MSSPKPATIEEFAIENDSQVVESRNANRHASNFVNRIKQNKQHFILRVAVLVFSGLSLIGFGVCSAISRTPFYVYNDQGYVGDICLIPLGFAFLLSLAYILVILFRKKGLPHPGFSVGLDLVTWVALFSLIIIVWMLGGDSSNSYGCYNVSEKRCDELARTFFGWLLTAEISGTIVVVLHFILFVIACIETDRLRKEKKVKKQSDNRRYSQLA